MNVNLNNSPLFLALLMAIVTTTSAQVVYGQGSCPNTGSISPFATAQYLGTWYEYERFDNWFEVGLICGKAEYGDNGDGSISVRNSGLREISIFGRVVYRKPSSVVGTAIVPDPTKPAELRVSFSRFDRFSTGPNYFVVDTDYTNYAVVFSCSELPGNLVNIQFAWILTRVRGQAPANLAQIKTDLTNLGINVSNFKLVGQSDCSQTPSKLFFA